MQHPQIPTRYAHLATGPWELSFLSNSDYVQWLDSFASIQPLQPHERLLDYVRQRLPSTPSNPSRQQSYPSHQPPPSSHSTHSPAPQNSFHHHNSGPLAQNTMNGSSGVEFSDLIDYSALGDDVDSSASYAAALDNPFTSVPIPGGGGANTPSTSTSFGNNVVPAHSFYSASSSSAPTAVSGYPGPSMPSSSFPPPSSSAGLAYSSISGPYASSPAPQGPYYGGAAPSVNPSFFNPQTSTSSATSTLAMQSQLIQDERNRRNAALSMSPAPFLHPTPTTVHSQPPPATTISPSMMTTSQFSPPPVAQPVASTSRASSAAAPSPPPKKAASSTSSSSSKSRSSTSSSSATSDSVKRWNKVVEDVRANLTASRLSKAPASTVPRLINLLSSFNHVDGPSSTLSDWSDGSDVPPEGRKEVLSNLLKYASEAFWAAWVGEGEHGKENPKSQGIELLSYWFEGASKGIETKKDKDKDKMKEKETNDEGERKKKQVEQMTLALILQAFAKLPLTHRHLGNLGTVAKRVRKISLKGDEGAVKAAATRLFEKWRKVQDDYNSTYTAPSTATSKDKKLNGTSKEKDADSSKRKSSSTEDGPTKKAKITTTTSSIKKPSSGPTSYAPVTATKVAPNLSFKKKTDSGSMNAMRAALSTVKAKKVDPAASSAASAAAAATAAVEAKKTAKGKVKKSVTWAPDDTLEAIRWIEKAIYDEDEAQGKTGLGLGEGEEAEENFREMEQQEGMSLSMHLDEDEDMEEEIEWYTPIEVVIPETEDFASLRQEPDSAEARIQTEREANLMEVDPESLDLDSPTEPPEYAPNEPDPEPKIIPLSADLATDHQVLAEIAAAQSASVPLGGFAANDQIESLLGQLNTTGLVQPQALAPTGPLGGIDPATLDALKGYDVEQIRQIIAAQPAFHGLTVENLGLVHQEAQAYAAPPPAHPYGHDPHAAYSGHASWGQPPPPAANTYGTPWQPNAPVDAYNGYVPPPVAHSSYDHGHASRPPLPSQSSSLKKGKRKTLACKFFKTSRGCDWGEKCAFIHDSS